MNAEQAQKLARRFIELPSPKRQLFLQALRAESVDFSLLPIPAGVEVAQRDDLSYAQQRMWLLWQLDPQGAAYNLPMAARLRGALALPALQRALDALVARHETLRTRFGEVGEAVRQQVDATATLPIRHDDLRQVPAAERQAHWTRLAEQEALAPFDLNQGPLLRVRLLALDDEEHVLLLTLHHIVADGWSMNVLIDELLRLYDAAVQGVPAALAALPVQYRDYALWQRSWLEAGEQARQLAYWRDKLGSDHAPLALPLDRPRQGRPTYQGARHAFAVPHALATGLRSLAQRHNVTLFMVLLASFKLLLQRYSGQGSIRVGVPIANRQRNECEGLIGCFINTQVLQTEIDPVLDTAALLQRVRETALGAQAHQDLPFERLVEALDVPRAAHSPLFQVLFNHQANVADIGELRTASGLALAQVELQRHSARFDLALDTHERAGQLHAAFTFATDVFEAATVQALGEHWLHLLQALAADAPGAVGEWPLPAAAVPPTSTATATASASQTSELPVHQQFAAAARLTPDACAVVAHDRSLSYAALNQQADAVAHWLLEAGVRADRPVVVLADRSAAMLASILGVLKAGAAYLPLEPELAATRRDYLLGDSGATLLLAPDDWLAELPAGVVRQAWDALPACAQAPLQAWPKVAAEQLAYVIYTSGTTGQPKGVAVSHGALSNYVAGVAERLPMARVQRLAQVSTPAADLGHTMLFGALCHGKTLHLLQRDQVLDAQGFARYLREQRIDALKIVPSHLQAMLAAGADALPAECLVLGGEACTTPLLQQIHALAPALRVFNHYGPTETTVGVLVAELGSQLQRQPALGQPLRNSRVAVLDACLQAVPARAKGELFIGGAGLARGYLGRPGLTAERFVPDPRGTDGERLYRTGDWVRRDAQGELHFAGRMDGQVKIRGYRVELGEIEQQLRALPGVAQALVRLSGEAPTQQLLGYLVAQMAPVDDDAERMWLEACRTGAKRALPDYMVPAHLIALRELPVTANGKVDVGALPAPTGSASVYRAPHMPLQQQLAQIWAEVLQVEQVGLDDNFFALGGHSLLATQAVSRVRKLLGVEVALRALFDTDDLQAFAEAVAAGEQDGERDIARADRSQPLPVSQSQNRQWLFWKLNPESRAYNTPMAVRMRGHIDRAALQAALDGLVARHETLRTVLREDQGLPWLRVLPATAVPIAYEDLSQATAQAHVARLEQAAFAAFDLIEGPLLRVSLFKVGEDEHLLSIILHHIVSDGWSMSLMVREFTAGYNAAARSQTVELAPLSVQYADFAAWQRQWLADGRMQAQLDYWRTQLADSGAVLELPSDRPRPAVNSYRGSRVDVRLPAALTERLRALAVQANATLFHVLLAGYAVVLARYSRQDTINVGVPVTNRNRLEFEGLIGFFINVVVARIKVQGELSFKQLLAAIKETTLQAQANKDVPFFEVVQALQAEREPGVNPLFQVLYNHLRDLGQQVTGDALDGLQVEEVDLLEQSAQYDLSLNTLERSDGVTASFNYATDLFDAARIERMAAHWLTVLDGFCTQPQGRIGELPLLPVAERQALLAAGDSAELAPLPACAHQLFAAQAALRPQAVALVYDDQRLTYAELEQRTNQLAHRLREQGVGPERLVGVAAERGLGLAVALIAIHKAGGAYVPLDPEYPAERLAYMIEDSGMSLLLADATALQRLPADSRVPRLTLEPGTQWLAPWSSAPLAVELSADNLAYLIYTSGSTGQPKGVAIPHRALSVFCEVARDYSRIGAEDRVLQFATFSFDGFIEQFFPPLACGATVVLRDQRLWDTATFCAEIQRHGVTVADLPAAYWRLLALERRPAADFGALKQIHVGGEAVPHDALLAWFEQGPAAVRLLNTYGPTETTVVATTFDCSTLDGATLAERGVPIGRALPGRTARTLDDSLAPTPLGVAGELFIGSEQCLARGYHRRPALTAERFVPDPFAASPGARLYRTGDLGYFDDHGQIAYRGRADHQVKIRGFRIELGELEQCLRALPHVREAAVVAVDLAAGKQLCAYVVADADAPDDLPGALKAQLKASLPDYMLPAALIELAHMPLTPSGKLDRKALPLPDLSRSQHAYLAPQTPLQTQLAQIWAQLLGSAQVGLNDNFFELGGHSLLAAQMVSRINVELGIDLPLRLIFTTPVLGAFAQALDEQGHSLSEQGLSDIETMMNDFLEV
ncbi:amino acid adenylation domain-containing protein [Pseudomonas sp. MLB6B]